MFADRELPMFRNLSAVFVNAQLHRTTLQQLQLLPSVLLNLKIVLMSPSSLTMLLRVVRASLETLTQVMHASLLTHT